jgi:hypothetical protein
LHGPIVSRGSRRRLDPLTERWATPPEARAGASFSRVRTRVPL